MLYLEAIFEAMAGYEKTRADADDARNRNRDRHVVAKET